jgi:hypothetical protein
MVQHCPTEERHHGVFLDKYLREEGDMKYKYLSQKKRILHTAPTGSNSADVVTIIGFGH